MKFPSVQRITVNGVAVAANSKAEMYEWSDGSWLKLFNPSVADSDIDSELRKMAIVKSLGVYVPEFQHQIVKDVRSGRKGYFQKKKTASSLFELLEKNPFRFRKYCKVLASVHSDCHQIKASEGLPCQIEDICRRIISIRDLSVDLRKKTIKLAESMPTGDRLCHGDLTPNTVLHSDQESYAIEWRDVRKGNPLCDIARTSLILSSSGCAGSPLHRAYGKLLGSCYLKAYSRLANKSPHSSEFRKWIRVNAAYRLGDKISDKEKSFMLKLAS